MTATLTTATDLVIKWNKPLRPCHWGTETGHYPGHAYGPPHGCSVFTRFSSLSFRVFLGQLQVATIISHHRALV